MLRVLVALEREKRQDLRLNIFTSKIEDWCRTRGIKPALVKITGQQIRKEKHMSLL